MNNGRSSSSSSMIDPKKVKEEPVSSEDESEPAPIQRIFADVMQELGVKMQDLDDFINRLDPEERGWIRDQTAKNVSEVAKVVPFARRKDMEHTTKYQQMLLAQKRKAIEQFHERNSTGARFNPQRSAKSKVAETGYGDQGHEADDDEVEVVFESEGSGKKKKKYKKH